MAEVTSAALARRAGEGLEFASADLLLMMVQTSAEALMSAEAGAVCGAPGGQWGEERVNRRSGYRQRPLGYAALDNRAGHPDAAAGQLLSGPTAGAAAPTCAMAGRM